MGLWEGWLEKFALALFYGFLASPVWCRRHHYTFNIEEAKYTRLCRTKSILTVNGQFPGPTIHAHHGETVVVKAFNRANENITLHWHGVKQPRNPWSDGPAYITQCPIKPGAHFTYRFVLSGEEGTIWWHAHIDWARATVHGAIVVYPEAGSAYPYPKPHEHTPIILGEWWKSDVKQVLEEMLRTGGAPNVSDAFTINGQPGDLYPCSKQGTHRIDVQHGKRYLLRVVNAAMNDELFFSVARHPVTVVGADGSYTKPFTTRYVMITPGQTMDLLLDANQNPTRLYYLAARAYSSSSAVDVDNTTATAILQYYARDNGTKYSSSNPLFPSSLPAANHTGATTSFVARLRSLASADHPANVPLVVDDHLTVTTSINEFPCANNSCEGPNGTRLAASLNNISFVNPSIDILRAYYRRIAGVFGAGFPSRPPLLFDFTAADLPLALLQPRRGTQVKVLEYNRSVEVVFQGTSLVAALNHPMHLHGYSFYVVGQGFGNFDRATDTPRFNLVDPPKMNTFGVARNGWIAVRFRTTNPGVWFLHCHLERHVSWGMETVFIVKNGRCPEEQMLPPPRDMPPC